MNDPAREDVRDDEKRFISVVADRVSTRVDDMEEDMRVYIEVDGVRTDTITFRFRKADE